jgi:hypothetical protein
MIVQINTVCWQWWKRLSWCLSSLCEQRDSRTAFQVRVNICTATDAFAGDLGAMVRKTFDGMLSIDWIDWADTDAFAFRNNLRNRDLAEVTGDLDWILWLDPDILLHPNFGKCCEMLDHYPHNGRVLSMCRAMPDVELCNALVADHDYAKPVPSPFQKFNIDAELGRGSTVGAGYFQLVNYASLIKRGIRKYAEITRDASVYLREQKYHTTAEKTFRSACGGVRRLRGFPPLIHVEHYRGNDPRFDPKGCY